MWKKIIALWIGGLLISCLGDEGVGSSDDGFDRQAMLENWADNIILPGYEAYVSSLEVLSLATATFSNQPSLENLSVLRSAWLDAYLIWQHVAMFEIGKAEEVSLINYTNIYPTDIVTMAQTIESGSYDLSSVNRQDEQGFPAIEYLIYGIRNSDQAIVDFYSEETAQPYHTYLKDLAEKLETLAIMVVQDWQNGYRDSFVGNDGSDASSSVNKVVNDYIYYYEKHLRAGKIGIPAGVFSEATFPDKVEGLYSGSSKVLFSAGLEAMQSFFNGKHYNSNLNVEGKSLRAYLDYLNTIKEGEDLGSLINTQFDQVKSAADQLNDDFGIQVDNENSRMLSTYDALQLNVIYMKVDMAQAMSIGITYMDADGD